MKTVSPLTCFTCGPRNTRRSAAAREAGRQGSPLTVTSLKTWPLESTSMAVSTGDVKPRENPKMNALRRRGAKQKIKIKSKKPGEARRQPGSWQEGRQDSPNGSDESHEDGLRSDALLGMLLTANIGRCNSHQSVTKEPRPTPRRQHNTNTTRGRHEERLALTCTSQSPLLSAGSSSSSRMVAISVTSSSL